MRKVLVFAMLLWCAPADGSQAPTELPLDLDEGVIDGAHAMAVVPTAHLDGRRKYLSPAGFEAHLQKLDDPWPELVYPAGTWFLPPAGWYHVWVEGNGWVSPYPEKLSYAGGVETVVRPTVVPGGRVRVGRSWAGGGYEFLLMSADPQDRHGHAPYELVRRLPAAQVGEGLMLAEGHGFAALWDETEERYVALTRPFAVEHESVVDAPFEVPGALAHLFVDLAHPPGEFQDLGTPAPSLHRQGGALPPDLLIHTAFRSRAVWYDLKPGPAVVTVTSPLGTSVPEELNLAEGLIEHRRIEMVPRRTLELSLELPEPARTKRVTVRLRRLSAPEGAMAEAVLRPGDTHHRFEGLAATLADVEVATALGSLYRRVDLRDQQDNSLELAAELLRFRGRVTSTGRSHAATLTLRTIGGEEKSATTSTDGAYEAILLEPLRSLETWAVGSSARAVVDVFSPAIDHDQELDVALLGVGNRVRVLDSSSGQPIPGARVTIRNAYRELDDSLGHSEEKTVFHGMTTDGDGLARLPMLRPGRLEVRADADGYAVLEDSFPWQVADPADATRLRIVLVVEAVK